MASYCDIEEVKMTSNPVYEVADMKPPSISTPKNEKSILKLLLLQRKNMFNIIFFCCFLFLLFLLIAVLVVTVSSSRKPVYSSCADIAESSPSSVSGYYFIKSSNGSHVQVYCEMEPVCGGGRRGWTRAIHQQYFNWINIRSNSCLTYNAFVNFGIKYNHLCVQLQGILNNYNWHCAAFSPEVTIDESYVHGISITHVSPRQHVFSFGCEDIDDDEYSIPKFVGSDYIWNNCDNSRHTCNFHFS